MLMPIAKQLAPTSILTAFHALATTDNIKTETHFID
jgi:hypothetical protein